MYRLAATACIAAVLAAACSVSPTSATPKATAPPLIAAQVQAAKPAPTAAGLLARLAVKGRAPKTGYSRAQFGQEWADVNRNGCDTRNDILNRDLDRKAWRAGTGGCVVVAGVLNDPYTGRQLLFAKANAIAVQIDHVVALSDAWQKGAQALAPARRQQFANDPLNLLAVDGPANQQKGDSDAASWLPAYKQYRCAYVARQVTVKANYGLWVTAAERDAIAAVLRSCPTELPSTATPGHLAFAAPPATPAAPTPAPTTPGGAYYANCSAARAAGAAPLRRGQPGYRPELDRDNDGVACE